MSENNPVSPVYQEVAKKEPENEVAKTPAELLDELKRIEAGAANTALPAPEATAELPAATAPVEEATQEVVVAPGASINVLSELSADSPLPGGTEHAATSENPLSKMNSHQFYNVVESVLNKSPHAKVLKLRGITVNRHITGIKAAFDVRSDVHFMSFKLQNLVESALNAAATTQAKSQAELAQLQTENKQIAAEIAQAVAEYTPEVRKTFGEKMSDLLESVKGVKKTMERTSGTGVSRVLGGLKRFYESSISATLGRQIEVGSTFKQLEVPQYTLEGTAAFTRFAELFHSGMLNNSILSKRLKEIKFSTERDSDSMAKAADAQKALGLLAEMAKFDSAYADADAIYDEPEKMLELFGLLNGLNVTLPQNDGTEVPAAEFLQPFMPEVPSEETPEAVASADSAKTPEEAKKKGWELPWNRKNREAQEYYKAADLTYIKEALDAKLRTMHKDSTKDRSGVAAAKKALEAITAIEIAEKLEDKPSLRDIKVLQKQLESLSIVANEGLEAVVETDVKAEASADAAVAESKLPEAKKNWLRQKLEAAKGMLGNKAFWLGAGAGAAIDLIMYIAGIDHSLKQMLITGAVTLSTENVFSASTRKATIERADSNTLKGRLFDKLNQWQNDVISVVGPNLKVFTIGAMGGYAVAHSAHLLGMPTEHFDTESATHPSSAARAAENSAAHAFREAPSAAAPVVAESSTDHAASIPSGPIHVDHIVPGFEEKPDARDSVVTTPDIGSSTVTTATTDQATEQRSFWSPGEPTVSTASPAELHQSTETVLGGFARWWQDFTKPESTHATTSSSVAQQPATAPSFTENLQHATAGADISANIHDGSTSAAHAATGSANSEAIHAVTTGVQAGVEAATSGSAVKIETFGHAHPWGYGAEVSTEKEVTDGLKDAQVAFNNVVGGHDLSPTSQVAVVDEHMHSIQDLLAIKQNHPEIEGFKLTPEQMHNLEAFYSHALKTPAADRTQLEQEIVTSFFDGASGADNAKKPELISALLHIAHGEKAEPATHTTTVSQTETKPGVAPAQVTVEPTVQTGEALLAHAQAEYHNMHLAHPSVAIGVMDNWLKESPGIVINRPDLVGTFVSEIWDKWEKDTAGHNSLTTAPVGLSPVRSAVISYIQHGESMPVQTIQTEEGLVKIDLEFVHRLLDVIDKNDLIGQIMARDGVDSVLAQANTQLVFKTPQAYDAYMASLK